MVPFFIITQCFKMARYKSTYICHCLKQLVVHCCESWFRHIYYRCVDSFPRKIVAQKYSLIVACLGKYRDCVTVWLCEKSSSSLAHCYSHPKVWRLNFPCDNSVGLIPQSHLCERRQWISCKSKFVVFVVSFIVNLLSFAIDLLQSLCSQLIHKI